MQFQGAVKGLPLEDVISDVLQAKWDHERTKFSLPPSMTLVSLTKNAAFIGIQQLVFKVTSITDGFPAGFVSEAEY